MSNPKICLVIDTPGSESSVILEDLVEHGGYKSSQILSIGEVMDEGDGVADIVFYKPLMDKDLLDQVEAFKRYIDDNTLEVSRVIAVLNGNLLKKGEEVEKWLEAAIHFSDYVLFTNVEGLPEGFLKKYIQVFQKEKCYPCIFEEVRKGQVKNPYLVLEGDTRRVTHIFDDSDVFDELDIDEDNLPDEPFILDNNNTDPYLKRDEDGRRLIKLPVINEYENN